MITEFIFSSDFKTVGSLCCIYFTWLLSCESLFYSTLAASEAAACGFIPIPLRCR